MVRYVYTENAWRNGMRLVFVADMSYHCSYGAVPEGKGGCRGVSPVWDWYTTWNVDELKESWQMT